MNKLYIAFIIFLFVALYIHYNQSNKVEEFQGGGCPKYIHPSNGVIESEKLLCLLDVQNEECKLDKNNQYPLHIFKTVDDEYLAVFNNGKLYKNSDIQNQNLWRGPLQNSDPKDNLKLIMVTYNRDGHLLGVGADGLIYVKTTQDIESPWNVTPLPNSGCVCYIMFDKDNRLLGLDMDGNLLKKADIDITSVWESTPNIGPAKQLQKIYWDLNGHLLGLGMDFKLYQKNMPNWEVSRWKNASSPTKVNDVIYDRDGRLFGIYINEVLETLEIRKQNQAYYTAEFYPLFDVKIQGATMLTNDNILQTKMGTTFEKPGSKVEESLNQVIDPSPEELHQEYTLESQKKLRDLCISKKKMYDSADYYDFELQRKIEVQDKLIDKLTQELDHYSASDKKYTQMVDKTTRPDDIMQLVPSGIND